MAQNVHKLTVFIGDYCLGEAEAVPSEKYPSFQFPNNEIRIKYISKSSTWCPPLAILHTISPVDILYKLQSDSPKLKAMHASCINGLKTAVVLAGNEEIHLVAMQSKKLVWFAGFWCFVVRSGEYDSCKRMLNIRSLALVYNLDGIVLETNTLSSFDTEATVLKHRISMGSDSKHDDEEKLSRYNLDRIRLYRYSNNDDAVSAKGEKIEARLEMVYQVADAELMFRPVIKLPDENFILTRMNPKDPSSSVFVRLRPHWTDCQIRPMLEKCMPKCLEFYVCTEYEDRALALEIWRHFDPYQRVISLEQLEGRFLRLPPGYPKSLSGFFRDGSCHPKLAIVMDRSKDKWDDNCKSQVYEAQVEKNLGHLGLKISRNSVWSVSKFFYEELEEILLPRVSRLCYEDGVQDLPPAPDVGNILKNIAPTQRREDPVRTSQLRGKRPVSEAGTSQKRPKSG